MEREIRALRRQLAACGNLAEETGQPIDDIERPILERISEMETDLADRKRRLAKRCLERRGIGGAGCRRHGGGHVGKHGCG